MQQILNLIMENTLKNFSLLFEVQFMKPCIGKEEK